MARRAVITGAPGAGKSALLAELGRRGIATEDEVARTILRQQGGMEMRANDPTEFAMAMFEAELDAYHRAKGREQVTVFDRGFADIAGFLRLEGLAVPPAIERACRDLRYDGPIFRAPPWEAIYHPDTERIQDWDGAIASDTAICTAWRGYGYELRDLPLVGIAQRAAFVEKVLYG